MITCEHYPSLPTLPSARVTPSIFSLDPRQGSPQLLSCLVLSQQSSPVRLLLCAVYHIPPWEQADNLIPAEFHLLSTLPKHSLLALLQEPKPQN